MENLQKVMDAQADWLRRAEEDIVKLEAWLSKTDAPLFESKAHGIAWARWSKGRKRLVFCDGENLGPIIEGTPAQMMDAFQKLPDFLTALADYLRKLLSDEVFLSIVVVETETKRISDGKVEEG